MSWSNDDPPDWIKLLTPKLTAPAESPVDKSSNALQDAMEKLYPRRWSSDETKPKVEVKPLDEDVINYLNEERLPDSEESLYDYGIRVTKEENDLYKIDMPPEPMLRILYKMRKRDNLVKRHAKEWAVGDNLEARWDINEDIFRGTVLVELPVYKIMLDETSFERIEKVPAKGSQIWGPDIPNPLGSPWGGSKPDPLALPGNWWFKLEHVEFYELLHPQVCGAAADLNSPWLAPSTLIKGFDLRLKDLLWLAYSQGLRPYVLSRKDGLCRILPDYVRLYGFTGCLFKSQETLSFVKANPDLCGLRKVTVEQLDQLEARDYARGRWQRDPTITIQAMAEEIQLTMRFQRKKKYKVSTIYNWIKGLCPNRKPGRRKKRI